MASNGEGSDRIILRNVSLSVTKDELRVIVREIDGVEEDNLVAIDINSVGDTNVVLLTFDSEEVAGNVKSILDGFPLGHDFTPIQVRFVTSPADLEEMENVEPVNVKHSAISPVKAARQRQPVENIVEMSKLRFQSPERDEEDHLSSDTPSPSVDIIRKPKHQTEGKSSGDVRGPKETSVSLKKGKDGMDKRQKSKAKSDGSGSLILKIKKIDSAVDLETMIIYLRKKEVKFADIDYRADGNGSDEVGTSEATLYFTCEGDVFAAQGSLVGKCAIGEEGAEAEVTLERVDQPYKGAAKGEGNQETQGKDSKPAKRRLRQKKKKEKEGGAGVEYPNQPVANQPALANQGQVHYTPPASMPPGQQPLQGQPVFMTPTSPPPLMNMPLQQNIQNTGPAQQVNMYGQQPSRYQQPPISTYRNQAPVNYGMSQPMGMPGSQRPPMYMNYIGQPPNQSYQPMGPSHNQPYQSYGPRGPSQNMYDQGYRPPLGPPPNQLNQAYSPRGPLPNQPNQAHSQNGPPYNQPNQGYAPPLNYPNTLLGHSPNHGVMQQPNALGARAPMSTRQPPAGGHQQPTNYQTATPEANSKSRRHNEQKHGKVSEGAQQKPQQTEAKKGKSHNQAKKEKSSQQNREHDESLPQRPNQKGAKSRDQSRNEKQSKQNRGHNASENLSNVTDERSHANSRVSGRNERETPKKGNRRGNKSSSAKQVRDKLAKLESETTEAKVSRMLNTMKIDDEQERRPGNARPVYAAADDDVDSVMSDLSSASHSNHQRHQSKPSSKALLVTGFDASATKHSFEQFLKERGVNHTGFGFRGGSTSQRTSALVHFKTPRDTTGGKRLLHAAIMDCPNGKCSMLKAEYQWDDERKRRDGRSEAGSTVSARSNASQQHLSTSLVISGLQQGIDPAALSNFLQEEKDKLRVKSYEFKTDNHNKLYALLEFETPKECSHARSKLHGKSLAMNATNVKAMYPKQKPVAERQQQPPDFQQNPGEASGAIPKRRGGRSRPDQQSNAGQDPSQTSNRAPIRSTANTKVNSKLKQECWFVKVTAIDESEDEEAFMKFLRRKRIRPNDVKWWSVKRPTPSNGATLSFNSIDDATAAQRILNDCLLGDGEMKAQVSSSAQVDKLKRPNNRRRQRTGIGSTDAGEDGNGTTNTGDDKDDAGSDISSAASSRSTKKVTRRQRVQLTPTINVRNIDPNVDENDFRDFLLSNVDDFTELQFVLSRNKIASKRSNTAVVRFDTPDEAKRAKEAIHGKSLGKSKRCLQVSHSNLKPEVVAKPVEDTSLKDTDGTQQSKGDVMGPEREAKRRGPRPQQQQKGNPNEVVIDDIARFVREADLASLIADCDCKGFRDIVIKEDETASSKRSAFVTFQSRADAVEAITKLFGKRLKGFVLNVRLAQEQAGLGNLVAKKKIEALLNEIEAEGIKVAAELDSRMSDLAFQVKELEEKVEECNSIHEAVQLDQQKEAIKQQMDEIQGYQTEFQQVSAMTKSQLDQMQPLTSGNVDLTALDNVRQRFLRECRRTKKPLPIYGHKAYILETITASDTNACVIRAETGSGKSTQVPQYLIEDHDFLTTSADGARRSVICTQPRRVAAISLARRVAEEYGCKVGEEVGYVAGQSRKTSARTLVTFMTDRALLNKCLADKSDLNDCACMIIDEAHERSVDTDILLAMLKKIQQRRHDLKVVIMSATIDVNLFSNYLYNCPVVDVPGRTFPVDTVWCGSKETKDPLGYISRAVEKAVEIHRQEESGDILVFLTSQNEIERACDQIAKALKIPNWQDAKKEDVIILPLHGKLQPDDQMKVFKEPPDGKRKIVFSTNVAETSVTIPGIKYVIDSGMVKECQYDPQRNMSLLKVTGITQASAEQRQGRAGRTGPGRCYRLYGQSEYDEMEESMKPEILRVHLGMAMLQLIQMGVHDVETFDFVQSPEEGAIQQAMKSLILLGAVGENRQLTSLGEQMAQLPLEPRLAKLVLSGIENNVGDEAVALAALVSAPGNIIFRGSSEADQQRSEMMKLKYSSDGGDLLTMLKIFKVWSSVPEKGRNVWCKQNSMNAKTLRAVKDNADEIRQILKRNLKKDIKKVDDEEAEEGGEGKETVLRKLLMSVYFENLSVYNGHPKAGYTIVTQMKTAVVHPSSVLKSMKPHKWLIYGDLRRTTQDFVCDLTPVELKWIVKETPQSFSIDFEALAKNSIREVQIADVGTALMKTLAMKRFERLRGLEDAITKEANTPCIIEADWEAGNLNIFIAGRYGERARKRVGEYLDDERTRARREQKEVPVGSSGRVRHVVVMGGETGFVLMGDEYRSLDISCIPMKLSKEEVMQLCGCPQDQVKEVFKFPDHWSQAKKGVWGRVTFFDPSVASQVKNKLEQDTYPGEDETISAQPSLPKQSRFDPRKKPVIETKVEVTWFLGSSKGIAFVSCQTSKDSLDFIDDVQGLPLRGRQIHCELKNDDTRKVVIKKLDKHVTQDELEDALKRATRVSFNSVSIPRNKPEQHMKNATAKRSLRQHFTIEDMGQLDINVLDPRSEKSQRRLAFVNFDPSFHQQMNEKVRALQVAAMFTENQEIYHARMRVTSYIFCTEHMYRSLKDQIDEFVDAVEGSGEDITVKTMQMRNRADGWRLQVSGTDYQKIFDVRTALKTLINGEEIPVEDFVGHDKSSQWIERALHNLAQLRLEEFVGDSTSAFIDVDRRRRVIHVYGKEKDRDEFKVRLHEYFFSLTNTEPIQMQGIKGAILRALVLKFGPWLEQLKDEPGVEDVTVYAKKGLVRLSVAEENKESVKKKIQECINDCKMGSANEEFECGICFCPAESDEKTYRLLSCGHYFCLKCLQDLLQHNMTDKTFPVICPCGECEEPLTLVDIRTIVPEEETQIKFFRAALEAFVLQKKDGNLKFCPSPDCCMIYRQTKSGTTWTCSECGHQICSGCGEDPHPGDMTCAEYKVSKESSDAVWQWARTKGANVQQCPTPDCTFIEKFEGCNRVQCVKCKKQICWKCLASFDTSKECYKHLEDEHGGCFEYDNII